MGKKTLRRQDEIASESVKSDSLSFWKWLFRGVGAKPGYTMLITYELIFHVIAGVFLAIVVEQPLQQSANSVVLPLTGILIGLTFAWGGNAQTLLQTPELQKMSHNVPGGIRGYAAYYQLAILLILFTLILWGLFGIGAFTFARNRLPASIRFLFRIFMYALTSLTFFECWHVVDSVRKLLIARYEVSEANFKNDSKSE